jgi:carbon monoxide dehydrogenase subunit G
MASASRELLAAPAEVWAFLAEPNHLADWWPGVVAVESDRRGFAAGARWRVVRRAPRGLLNLSAATRLGRERTETLVVVELAAERLWRWRLVGVGGGARVVGPLAVSIGLAEVGPGRTRVSVSVESMGLGAGDRLTARAAADRLYALVQTAAEL